MYQFTSLFLSCLLLAGVSSLTFAQGTSEKKKTPAAQAVKPKKTQTAKPVKVSAAVKKKAPAPKAKKTRKPAAPKSYLPPRENLLPIHRRGEKAPAVIKIREAFDFYLYAGKGQRIPVTFTCHASDDSMLGPAVLTVLAPGRTKGGKGVIPHRNKLNYLLRAGTAGVYCFRIRPRSGAQSVSIECAYPGQAVVSSKGLSLTDSSGTVYFAVPAGVKRVALTLKSVRGKESDAALLGPGGEVFCEKKRFAGNAILSAVRKNPSRNEIWAVRFNASSLLLRLHAPIPPLYSLSPMNVLVRKGTQRKYGAPSWYSYRSMDVVRNGHFRNLERVNRRFKITSKEFPRFWGGNGAAIFTSKDNRNHIDFTNLLWSYLTFPRTAGKFRGEITLSGKGEVTAYLRTSPGKTSYKVRKPVFGPFRLTAKPETFTFTFAKGENELGYIYIKANEKLDTKARLSNLSILPVPEKK